MASVPRKSDDDKPDPRAPHNPAHSAFALVRYPHTLESRSTFLPLPCVSQAISDVSASLNSHTIASLSTERSASYSRSDGSRPDSRLSDSRLPLLNPPIDLPTLRNAVEELKASQATKEDVGAIIAVHNALQESTTAGFDDVDQSIAQVTETLQGEIESMRKTLQDEIESTRKKLQRQIQALDQNAKNHRKETYTNFLIIQKSQVDMDYNLRQIGTVLARLAGCEITFRPPPAPIVTVLEPESPLDPLDFGHDARSEDDTTSLSPSSPTSPSSPASPSLLTRARRRVTKSVEDFKAKRSTSRGAKLPTPRLEIVPLPPLRPYSDPEEDESPVAGPSTQIQTQAPASPTVLGEPIVRYRE